MSVCVCVWMCVDVYVCMSICVRGCVCGCNSQGTVQWGAHRWTLHGTLPSPSPSPHPPYLLPPLPAQHSGREMVSENHKMLNQKISLSAPELWGSGNCHCITSESIHSLGVLATENNLWVEVVNFHDRLCAYNTALHIRNYAKPHTRREVANPPFSFLVYQLSASYANYE